MAAQADADTGLWLVVGLGNPGPGYAGHRHNAGAMVVDHLAAELRERFTAHRSRAQLAQVRLASAGGRPGAQLVLAKPTSYMNESGQQVAAVARFFQVPVERVLVVHDELDIPFGELRLKRGGGEGGHNGLRSISQSLASKDFARLRIGIGRPPGRMDAAAFVLQNFAGRELPELGVLIVEAADAVLDVVRLGWERTQNAVNTVSGDRG